MLNFIEMLSARPAPVKGGRIVKGYAMSGSPSANETVAHHNNKIGWMKAAEKTAIIIRKRRESRKKEILDELRTWNSVQYIAQELGFSETNTATLIKELKDEGKLKSEKRGSTTYYMRF